MGAEVRSAEAVAVVGIGCRFPGDVASPEDFWQLLSTGRVTVGDVPEDRWRAYRDLGPDYESVLRRTVRSGSFLSGIDQFDAAFFGISPREAALMDPQQRLLMEVAWEALEHAGIPPGTLAGGDTSVFVGVSTTDYGDRLLEHLPTVEAWTGIGAATCAVANRISHALDLRGPSMAVDTACSASLVALHLASQSLALGESGLALVGGVNLIVSPGQTVSLGASGALSPDGRSKSFDATADGYGRGEGCGVVVLKRLADAERDGDRVFAVIRGSAVQQDGHTDGIMAPCGTAQEDVIVAACRRAGVEPGIVDYVEAHGTGTRVGDPIEASALTATYGAGRAPEQPCFIGSVKSNIGHLEGAAGIAGFIKAVLALRHEVIPPNPLYDGPNPAIDWARSGLRIVTEPTAWPARDHPRLAAVSGFGYGGTIAHIVVEQAAQQNWHAPSDSSGEHRLYPLSADSPTALRAYSGALADWLDKNASADLPSVGHTLASRRSHLTHRAVIVADGRDPLVTALRRLADDAPTRDVVNGASHGGQQARPVWMFSGHGSQWRGMGLDLLEREPVFAAVIDELAPIFIEEGAESPRQTLLEGRFDEVDQAQTMIFAVQLGLAALWRANGVTPAAVIGHSVGEVAAAVTCGALTLEDGARLICRRSHLLRQVAGKGGMAMVSLPFDEVVHRLAGRDDLVPAIASSLESTVVSGEPDAIDAVLVDWPADGVAVRKVNGNVAFHSPQMDPLATELAAALADLSPADPRIPMYSTTLAEPRQATRVDGAYWAANLRDPVRLAAAVEAAARDGHRAFLEISAHPVIAHSIRETLDHQEIDDAFVGSTLRRDQPEQQTFLASVGQAHCNGVAVDWSLLQPGGMLADLPTYVWQHRGHWQEPPADHRSPGRGHDLESHSLLGTEDAVAGTSLRTWRTVLDDSTRPYPGNHLLGGVEIIPAAVLVSTFLQAMADTGRTGKLANVSMLHPLTTGERREIEVVDDHGAMLLASRAAGDPDPNWLVHASADAAPLNASAPLPALADVAAHHARVGDPDLVQQRLSAAGVHEAGFNWAVERLLYTDDLLRALVTIGSDGQNTDTWAAVIDAVTAICPAVFAGEPRLRVLDRVDEIVLTGEPLETLLVEVTADAGRDSTVDALVAAVDGTVVARLAGLRYPVIGDTTVQKPETLIHGLAWHSVRSAAPAQSDPRRDVTLVGATGATADVVGQRLRAAGLTCRVVASPADWSGSTDVVFLPPDGPGTDDTMRTAQLITDHVQSADDGTRLWCLTVGVREAVGDQALRQAPLWGLPATARGERRLTVVDLAPNALSASAALLPGLLRAGPDEDLMTIRDGIVQAARLARVDVRPGPGRLYCRAHGTFLVVGGLSEPGLRLAGWLADHGARRLVLTDHSPFPPRTGWDDAGESFRPTIDAIRDLEKRGVTVRPLCLDVADTGKARELLSPDALGLPPILGVAHSTLPRDEAAEFSLSAARHRMDEASTLNLLFPPGSVDFFLLLSPGDHMLGPRPGAAVAGAYFDALATHRRAAGCPAAVSLARQPEHSRATTAPWLADITDPLALQAGAHAVEHGPGAYMLLHAVHTEDDAERPPLLQDVAPVLDLVVEDEAGPSVESFDGLSRDELRELLTGEIQAQIAAELRLAEEDLDIRRPLAQQGLDSVLTVVIRRRFEKRYGHILPATLFWERPTVTAITAHLVDLLSPDQTNGDAPSARTLVTAGSA